jgi:hypothetical protein
MLLIVPVVALGLVIVRGAMVVSRIIVESRIVVSRDVEGVVVLGVVGLPGVDGAGVGCCAERAPALTVRAMAAPIAREVVNRRVISVNPPGCCCSCRIPGRAKLAGWCRVSRAGQVRRGAGS